MRRPIVRSVVRTVRIVTSTIIPDQARIGPIRRFIPSCIRADSDPVCKISLTIGIIPSRSDVMGRSTEPRLGFLVAEILLVTAKGEGTIGCASIVLVPLVIG